MPELPEVEIFRRYFNHNSLHKKIKEIKLTNSKILYKTTKQQLRNMLKNDSFKSSSRHGKYLFIKTEKGKLLLIHFGMTGFLKYFKNISNDTKHNRLLISFNNGYHLAYNCQRLFGKVGIIDSVAEFIKIKKLGPDALYINFSNFKHAIKYSRGMIKTTLMNQKLLAGIGNIYADEILFQTGIHPETYSNRIKLNKINTLFKKMKEVLQTAIECKVNSEEFPKNYLIPVRAKGESCPHCKSKIIMIKISARSTYFCPKCQINPDYVPYSFGIVG